MKYRVQMNCIKLHWPPQHNPPVWCHSFYFHHMSSCLPSLHNDINHISIQYIYNCHTIKIQQKYKYSYIIHVFLPPIITQQYQSYLETPVVQVNISYIYHHLHVSFRKGCFKKVNHCICLFVSFTISLLALLQIEQSQHDLELSHRFCLLPMPAHWHNNYIMDEVTTNGEKTCNQMLWSQTFVNSSRQIG